MDGHAKTSSRNAFVGVELKSGINAHIKRPRLAIRARVVEQGAAEREQTSSAGGTELFTGTARFDVEAAAILP